MHQKTYSACILLMLSQIISGESCYPVSYTKLKESDVSVSSQSSLVSSLYKKSLVDCMKHVVSDPVLLWLSYDKVSKECVTGQCWDVQLQEQMTSSQVVYRKRVSVPRSCSDVKTAAPYEEDGDFWIYLDAPTFLGCPSKIYCHNMSSESPAEYLSLSVTNTGVFPIKSNIWCAGETYLDGLHGTTHFIKMRINIDNMTVDSYDYTFTHGTGTQHPYGFAEDCYSSSVFNCGPRGTFDIDTRHTGVVVNPQQTWSTLGHEPHKVSVSRSSDGRQIHLLCGGACGGCKPWGDNLQLHRNSLEVLPSDSARFVIPE